MNHLDFYLFYVFMFLLFLVLYSVSQEECLCAIIHGVKYLNCNLITVETRYQVMLTFGKSTMWHFYNSIQILLVNIYNWIKFYNFVKKFYHRGYWMVLTWSCAYTRLFNNYLLFWIIFRMCIFVLNQKYY